MPEIPEGMIVPEGKCLVAFLDALVEEIAQIVVPNGSVLESLPEDLPADGWTDASGRERGFPMTVDYHTELYLTLTASQALGDGADYCVRL